MSEDFNQTDWNQSSFFAQEQTILRRGMTEARTKRDMSKWFEYLESFYMSVSPLLGENELEEHEERYMEARKILQNHIRSKEALKTNDFDFFRLWERDLRRAEDNVGLLVKKGEDASLAIYGTS